jgi:cyclase
MLKRRLIPVLFLRHGWIVRSENFKTHQVIGDPVRHVERMVQWDVDELIVLDISSGTSTEFRHNRDDYRSHGVDDLFEFIGMIANECRIPLTFGGRLRTFEDIGRVIATGADKVSINTAALNEISFVTGCATRFGRQAIVVSIDYRMIGGVPVTCRRHGTDVTEHNVVDWARMVESAGAGEILLNSIDRDGTARGFDLATTQAVADAVDLPVISCGGAGHQSHFQQCFEETGASAVAAGNIFHFTENAYPWAKVYLRRLRDDIR